MKTLLRARGGIYVHGQGLKPAPANKVGYPDTTACLPVGPRPGKPGKPGRRLG